MERFFVLEFGSEGLLIETAQLDIYASWLGVALVVLSVVGAKIYKTIKKGNK
jgi:hypothetical protein